MPRARFIRPEFFTDEKIGELPFGARLLFPAIWTQTDLRGVFEWNAAQLKIKAFPYDSEVTKGKVAEWLELLENLQLVARFEAESKTWGLVTHWSRHQSFTTSEQKAGTRFPPPPSVRHESDSSQAHASSPVLTPSPAVTPTVGGETRARTTPAPPDSDQARKDKNAERVIRHLRGIPGLASSQDAAREWGTLLTNAGHCDDLDEVLEAITWIVGKAHTDGITITYSKHAPPALVKRWAAIVDRRRAEDANEQKEPS